MSYHSIKRIATSLLPKKVLYPFEPLLRKIFLSRYKGKAYSCNVCDNGLKKFVTLEDTDLLCPFCGSRSRTRALVKLLEEKELLRGKVLHFSPQRGLYRKLSRRDAHGKKDSINYITTDYENEFLADNNYDIMALPLDSASIDLIICFHILEHIEDDKKAMRELSRVLKPAGTCLIQTPFKVGEIYEDATIISPKERGKAFGQEDHVRVYSQSGLRERLLANGFTSIEVLEYDDVHLGISQERILIAKTDNLCSPS